MTYPGKGVGVEKKVRPKVKGNIQLVRRKYRFDFSLLFHKFRVRLLPCRRMHEKYKERMDGQRGFPNSLKTNIR